MAWTVHAVTRQVPAVKYLYMCLVLHGTKKYSNSDVKIIHSDHAVENDLISLFIIMESGGCG